MKIFLSILSILGFWHYFIVTGLLSLIRGTTTWAEFCNRFTRLSDAPALGILLYTLLWIAPPILYLSCLIANIANLSWQIKKRLFILACVSGILFLPWLYKSYTPMLRDGSILLILWAISLWIERKRRSSQQRSSKLGNIVILGEKEYLEFSKQSNQAPKFSADFTPEMLQAEFEQFQNALKQECAGLKGHYEFGDDYQDDFFHCGGIYSNSLFSSEYVDAVKRAIARLPHARKWYYHTACELEEEEPVVNWNAEFYIHDGKVYAPDDGNDYTRLVKK